MFFIIRCCINSFKLNKTVLILTMIFLSGCATSRYDSDLDNGRELCKLGKYYEAFPYIKKSAINGNPEAQQDVASMYASGTGVAMDASAAEYWFKKSAEAGNADAMRGLSALYQSGAPGIVESCELSLKYIHDAVDHGDLLSIATIGYMYSENICVERDYVTALHWFERADSMGEESSKYSLGVAYRDALGVKKDCEKAHRYFEKSAALGDAAGREALNNFHCVAELNAPVTTSPPNVCP